MLICLCAGVGYSWSVFQGPLIGKFAWDPGAVSLIFTIQVLISTLFPPLIGHLQKKISINNYLRLGAFIYSGGLVLAMFASSLGSMYLFYGVITGIGNGMLYPCVMAYSGRLYPEKRGFVSGVLACAYGAGSMIWAPLAAHIMGFSDVSFTFAVLGVIYVVCILPVTFLIKEPPADFLSGIQITSKANAGGRNYTPKEMLCSPVFYTILIAMTLGASAGLMIMGHASPILQEKLGKSPIDAAFIIGFISLSNAVGRLGFGMLSDKLGRCQVMFILFAVIGGAMIILANTGGFIFTAALFFVGAGYGGFAAMFSPLAADFFGLKNLRVNYTFLYTAYGLAGILGPQLAVRAKSWGGYEGAFIIVALFCVVGIFLSGGLIIYLKKAKSCLTENSRNLLGVSIAISSDLKPMI
ncbi:MAG: OFA family MFS transporter [Treponema sp.]|nr:OFA family MFS transporter [Treponema sp.]